MNNPLKWLFSKFRRLPDRRYRWTDRSRAVLFRANSVALERGARAITADHLWAGLLYDPGVGVHILISLGVSLDDLRAVVMPPIPHQPPDSSVLDYHSSNLAQKYPLSKVSNLVVERAIQESALLNDNYCGTEHLVLALIQTETCVSSLIAKANVTRNNYLAQLKLTRE